MEQNPAELLAEFLFVNEPLDLLNCEIRPCVDLGQDSTIYHWIYLMIQVLNYGFQRRFNKTLFDIENDIEEAIIEMNLYFKALLIDLHIDEILQADYRTLRKTFAYDVELDLMEPLNTVREYTVADGYYFIISPFAYASIMGKKQFVKALKDQRVLFRTKQNRMFYLKFESPFYESLMSSSHEEL